MTGRRTSRATWRVASESAGEAIGKPGLDDVHAERVERAGHACSLAGTSIEKPGRLLAVAQRGVEDDDARGIVAHGVSCSAPAS